MKSVTLTEISGDVMVVLDPYDIWLLSYDPDKKITGVRFRNNTFFAVRESPEEIEKARDVALGR